MENAAVPPPLRRRPQWLGVAGALAAVAACTGAGLLLDPRFHQANLAMVYMLGVLAVSYWLGFVPALVASVLSALAFDFFFTPPRLSFSMDNIQDIFTFVVMLLVAFAISRLTSLARRQADLAGEREHRNAALYALSRELAVTRGMDRLLAITLAHIARETGCGVVALVPDAAGELKVRGTAGADATWPPAEATAAALALRSGEIVTGDTSTPLDAQTLYVPLVAAGKSIGVLRVHRGAASRTFSPDLVRLLEALAQHAALAVASEH
jgi:two-component system sensor histidine kinase KdpD